MSKKERHIKDSSLDKAEYFTNRELSWLEFNQRVLEEAQDPTQPLLERVKFLAITSTNLDEFFEIRVAGIKQQIQSHVTESGADGLTPLQIFNAVKERAHRMVKDQYAVWNNELKPQLAEHHIRFFEFSELSDRNKIWAKDYFIHEVFPALTPLAIDPAHPFPQLLNKSHNHIVSLKKKDSERTQYAVVQAPRSLNRLIRLPNTDADTHHYLLLTSLINTCVDTLFPGSKILTAHRFRITRNSDLYVDEEEANNLLAAIEEELQKRNRGNAVRLEMTSDTPEPIQDFLLQKCSLTRDDLYLVDGLVNLANLLPLVLIDSAPHLKYKPYQPIVSKPLQNQADLFKIMRKQDILLHHPYESFGEITELLEMAAKDPNVLAIKMTIYRTSGDSPVIKALIDAARNEKQVTVLVELKARFDEANNIAWARRMEEAGIHVLYGLVGLKTHCKALLIVRRDSDKIRHYAHLGTGNYHPKTARIYTDLGLLTTRKKITNEIAMLFNTLTGLSELENFQKLLVAPFNMANSFLQLIRNETENAKLGLPASIFAKINALVDPDIIKALYKASSHGVKITLMIRGINCLRPQIKGISENIECFSILDRYLEHSRIFYFENAGKPKVFLGSADWMPRNFYHRVEVVFPIEEKKIRQRIIHEIISTYLQDNTKKRTFLPSGLHERAPLKKKDSPHRCQEKFMELAYLNNQPSVPGPAPQLNLSEQEEGKNS